MDVDIITNDKTLPRETLLCSVCHKKHHLSEHEGIPRKKKGNHSLPQNLRKKK